ncbi:hypothetical protein Goshw_015415, partial [Gossypium schwendimanii]|nr:hypothetical protein [Gossypium schwendimanii]
MVVFYPILTQFFYQRKTRKRLQKSLSHHLRLQSL